MDMIIVLESTKFHKIWNISNFDIQKAAFSSVSFPCYRNVVSDETDLDEIVLKMTLKLANNSSNGWRMFSATPPGGLFLSSGQRPL